MSFQWLPIERIMRILGVLLFFPLIGGRAVRLLLQERVLQLVFLVFVVIPVTSLLYEPNVYFFVTTYGPFAVGGVALICLNALKSEEIVSWMAGVGLVTTIFLFIGLNRYGLETTTYYGNPRSHMGFGHPVQTASVILMAGLFSIQCIRFFLRRIRWVLYPTLIAVIIVILQLLIAASSRNTVLTAFLIIGLSIYAQVVKRVAIRFALILLFLLAPLIVYAIAIFGDIQSEFWNLLDNFSSGRLNIFRELMNSLSDVSPFHALFGPPLGSTNGGFASIESVYLSIFMNFGFMSLAGFFIFLLVLARRLSVSRQPLAYGCLCAVMIFFSIDAQGTTPSNLAIFLLLTYSLRSALPFLTAQSTIKINSRPIS